jgi:flagellar basal body-associated protein FliL
MKKRWIIIIVLVLLLASFTIYQFFDSRSASVVDIMVAQQASTASTTRAPWNML